MTKTKELQGNLPKYQQEYAENDFQIEKKKPFHPFSLLCNTQKNCDIFCLIFCDFLVPILTFANQRKWHFIFFHQEGHSAMVQKITKLSHAILEPTQKVSAFYNQCALRSDTPKLVIFNRG